jgi:hypothetical protein
MVRTSSPFDPHASGAASGQAGGPSLEVANRKWLHRASGGSVALLALVASLMLPGHAAMQTTAPITIAHIPDLAVQVSKPSGAFKSGFSVSLTATDPSAAISYTLDGTDPTPTSGTPYAGPIAVDATTTLKFLAFMTSGSGTRQTDVRTLRYVIDDKAPTARVSSLSGSAAPIMAGLYRSPVTATLSASDLGDAGLAKVEYSLDEGMTWTPSADGGMVTLSSEGNYTLLVRASDAAGNESAIAREAFAIDMTPPVPTIVLDGIQAPASERLYRSPVSAMSSPSRCRPTRPCLTSIPRPPTST